MRSFLIGLVIFFLFCAFSMDLCKAQGAEQITNFQSTIQVEPSGSVLVTETITANCLGNRIRHGIYRDIPIRYREGFWLSFKPTFRIVDVQIDGARAPFHTKGNGSRIRIYIGSRNRLISQGLHTFSITYEMSRMVRYFKDFDEIYWNVTGNEWAFPIIKAKATVLLPTRARFLKYATYTGKKGQRATMAKMTDMTEKSISFETTKPLYPGQGFTIAAAWPKGIVVEPSFYEKILFSLKDNLSILSAVGLILICIAYYGFAWMKVGKDPDLGPIVPSFEPPKGVGPAAARFIRRMGYDDKTFATTLVNLAVKGVIALKARGSSYEVQRTDLAPKEVLSDEERGVLGILLGIKRVISLTQANKSTIDSAIKRLKNALKLQYEQTYFKTNSLYLIPGLLLSLCAMAALALGAQEIPPAIFITFWLTVWSIFSLFLLKKGFQGLSGFFHVPFRQKIAALSGMVMALVFSAGMVLGGLAYTALVGPLSLFLFSLIILINLFFYRLMKAPTMKGAKIMTELEGFRMFLEKAEAPRLEKFIPPGKAPEIFEKYLPWAMALDVENEWAQNFEKYLKATGQWSSYRPTWYHGSYTNLSSMSSSVASGLSSSIATATFSSSGSGGGGSSGGGGGGGGGGGW